MGILFPEVRTTSVRLIWQPPAAPNGIILGKSRPQEEEVQGAKEADSVKTGGRLSPRNGPHLLKNGSKSCFFQKSQPVR